MTMGINNIEVMLSMQDTATPVLKGFNSELQEGLARSKSSLRELGMGVGFLGSAFLGMGVSLKASNDETAKAAGNMLFMVGGIMTAVSSTVQFVGAIARMTSALQKLNITQIIANALAGPGGWAKLAIGAAVAGATIYGVTKMSQGISPADNVPKTTVVQHIAGSVVTERQLSDNVQRGLLQKKGRNSTTGIER
jgi:hypothetical protein